MQIYLGWSGDRSKNVAMAFHDWLPLVIQSVKPFFSPDDIKKGTVWNSEIAVRLKEYSHGLFFITPEARSSKWIHFEAGALSKTIDESRVIPILLGIKKSQLEYPLAQFQNVEFNKNEIKELIGDLNLLLSEPIDDVRLSATFDAFWPQLAQKVEEALEVDGEFDELVPFDLNAAVSEVVNLSRSISESIQNVRHESFSKMIWPWKAGTAVGHKELGSGRVVRCRAISDGDWLIEVEFSGKKTRQIFLSSNALVEEYDPFADE